MGCGEGLSRSPGQWCSSRHGGITVVAAVVGCESGRNEGSVDWLPYGAGPTEKEGDAVCYLEERITMADVLIRGVEDQTPARLDQRAKQQGVSRNTLLKRLVEDSTRVAAVMDSQETLRVFDAMADVSNPAFSESAWR